MEDVQANIVAFHSKLNEFWVAEKHCDVIIEVEGKPFKCHRIALSIACEYFDKMFGGNFRESKQENVVLQESVVSISAFEEILRYVYTGDVVLTKDNVHCVLRASEFLNLPSIEELCIEYIQQNLPTSGVFETFTFARLSEKRSLLGNVARYLMEHFEEYYDKDEFVNLTFEDLKALLSYNWYLSSKNERRLVGAIIKWANYSRDVRGGYLEELIETINPQFMSSAESIKLTWTNGNTSHAPTIKYPIGNHESGLHVYMECENACTSVFSAYKSHPNWTVSCKMKHTHSDLKSVALENYLYCLGTSTSRYYSKQIMFRVCSTLDVSADESSTSHMMLKSPPTASSSFDLCSMQSRIYVNNYYGIQSDFTSPSNPVFSEEELSQGIYVYNIEVDQWFPTPLLTTKLSDATMVVCDNLLYLFGGASENNSKVQVLDCRVSKWQDLGMKDEGQKFFNSHVNCCAHDGKVYFFSPNGVGVLDPVAAKWGEVLSLPTNLCRLSHLTSYKNLLWVFGREFFPGSITVQTYNTCTREWNPSPIAGTLNVADDGQKSLHIRDIVVFKPKK